MMKKMGKDKILKYDAVRKFNNLQKMIDTNKFKN